jgi:hypothetical protein
MYLSREGGDDIGVVMYNPVEPISGADIYQVYREYGDKICFSGNIDIAGVLAFGTPDEVEEDVRHHIESLAADGGYILTSSHSITNDIPFENFLAMMKAGHRFGRYPLGADSSADPGCFPANRLRELMESGEGFDAEEKVFTPETRYGVCASCGNRAVTYLIPTSQKLCERCFKKEGWVLIHRGSEKGWKRSEVGTNY